MTGYMWTNASREDVLMMGDFLDDFMVAMAWVPTGLPEEAFDLFSASTLDMCMRIFRWSSCACRSGVECREGFDCSERFCVICFGCVR